MHTTAQLNACFSATTDGKGSPDPQILGGHQSSVVCILRRRSRSFLVLQERCIKVRSPYSAPPSARARVWSVVQLIACVVGSSTSINCPQQEQKWGMVSRIRLLSWTYRLLLRPPAVAMRVSQPAVCDCVP